MKYDPSRVHQSVSLLTHLICACQKGNQEAITHYRDHLNDSLKNLLESIKMETEDSILVACDAAIRKWMEKTI
jgi:hypothetical protein